MDNLTVEEFVEKYEKQNLPVVIDGNKMYDVGCTRNWQR